jgi:hypothetical protein
MANEYSAVDALISKGLIKWDYLPYVFVSKSLTTICNSLTSLRHHQALYY